MESLKRALENIGRLWANLTATQRVVVGAAAAAMVLLLVFSSVSAAPTWVRVAGAEVDRSSVLKKLQERNQKHEVRGSEIFVPKEDADRVITELAGDGTVDRNAVYKFLEQSDILATRWDKEKRLQIALQTRLEGMIRSIESVKNASVVINPGSTNHQLGFAGPKPSASVQVDLKEGMGLSRKNVQAIAGLVARAVSGVEEDQVLITDTRANSYRAAKFDPNSVSADSLREIESAKERDIHTQIKDSPFFAGASVVVRAQAISKTTKSEVLTHDRPVVIESTESSRTLRKGAPSPSGVRKGEGDSVPEPASGGDETEKQVHERSVVGTRKTTEDMPAGDIQRITVGVLIPVADGPRMTEMERQLPKLRDFVLKAAGPQARMEDVSVQLIPTQTPAAVAPVEEPGRALLWLAANWPKMVLAGLALAAVFVVLRIIQRSTAQDTVEELQALTTALTETRDAAAELAAPAESDLGRLRQGLQEMVGKNPQTVAASLKSFMSGR